MKHNFKNVYLSVYEEMSTKNIQITKKIAHTILKKECAKLNSEEKKLYEKIKNFLERNFLNKKYDVTNILNLLISNSKESELIICNFSKDVTKQNISEKVQLKVMSLNGVNMKKMSSSGKSSLRFSENNSSLVDKKSEGLTSRSFDYKIIKKTGSVEYVLGKVCNHQGGHQNSVKDEIIKFLRSANEYIIKNPNTQESFLALIDGDSFTVSDYEKFSRYTCGRVRVLNSDNYEE
jgi:hypothetical protein